MATRTAKTETVDETATIETVDVPIVITSASTRADRKAHNVEYRRIATNHYIVSIGGVDVMTLKRANMAKSREYVSDKGKSALWAIHMSDVTAQALAQAATDAPTS